MSENTPLIHPTAVIDPGAKLGANVRVGAFTLIAVLAIHVAAAAQHALIRRDGVWGRMWPVRGG